VIALCEYRERQAKLTTLAQDRGLNAVLCLGRGGAGQDRFADLFYFCGYYPQQPFVPDRPGHWRAQGHAAVLIANGGPSILFSDIIEFHESSPAADRFESDADVIGKIATAVVKEVKPGTIGVVGSDTLTFHWERHLRAALPHHDFVPVDNLSQQLRMRKSEAELRLLRAASRLGAKAVQSALATVRPGIRESEIAALAMAEIASGGGAYYGMGLSSGPWAHTFGPGLPPGFTTRIIEEHDLVRLDLYGTLNGYMFDLGRSRIAGSPGSVDQELMVEATREIVLAGIAAVRPGESLGAVARQWRRALADSAFARRLGTPCHPTGGIWGHGLGITFEEPWIDETSDVQIRTGMCLAVEVRLGAPGLGGANYEDAVIVTDKSAEIITRTADEILG
jgi:Xaa-Pro aminopeptidase